MAGLELCLTERLRQALAEDIGTGDITTALTVHPEDHQSNAIILAKSNLIVAGLPFAQELFSIYDSSLCFHVKHADGTEVNSGTIIASISGRTSSLLTVERVALNFLQRLSGIATLTHQFVTAVKETNAKIVDTRKTTPLLRSFEKYAITVGGGFNHRFGLFDGILIKDNHLQAAGGVKNALTLARKKAPHLMKIEIEVTNLEEFREAIKHGADAILLDNMTPADIRQAVAIADGRVILEASGGIMLDNVRTYAETGVDIISIGALTHSACAVDISMEIENGSKS